MLQSDCVVLKCDMELVAEKVTTELQSDCVVLKFIKAIADYGNFEASIGLCGIEIRIASIRLSC